MLIQDQKQTHTFWTKPRPWVFCLLLGMELLNFAFGARLFLYLGILYKSRGWTEASRILLQCSSFSNPWDKYAKQAEAYRRVRLPRHNIPHDAQEQNIDAFNLDQNGQTEEAVALFQQLIKKYPDFEWPYNNLAQIHAQA